jgi:acetylglutamate kinase
MAKRIDRPIETGMEILRYIEKAEILLDALPYIREFQNRTFVIKIGGAAMVDGELKRNFALDLVMMKTIGLDPIVVHGGGPQIGRTLDKMGIKSKFVDGHRVTDEETLDVVEMVLVGNVNKEIVSLINASGGKAVGLSGKDGGLIEAKRFQVTRITEDLNRPEIIDLGHVGEITAVRPEILNTLDAGNFIPVIAPVGTGKNGETYNINADFVAGAIASALKAEKLVLLTDEAGVLNAKKRLISTLTRKEVARLTRQKVIQGGMLPKVKCCLDALEAGVKKAHIIDGRVKHSILLEMFTKEGIGTEIVST